MEDPKDKIKFVKRRLIKARQKGLIIKYKKTEEIILCKMQRCELKICRLVIFDKYFSIPKLLLSFLSLRFLFNQIDYQHLKHHGSDTCHHCLRSIEKTHPRIPNAESMNFPLFFLSRMLGLHFVLSPFSLVVG